MPRLPKLPGVENITYLKIKKNLKCTEPFQKKRGTTVRTIKIVSYSSHVSLSIPALNQACSQSFSTSLSAALHRMMLGKSLLPSF